MQNITFDTHENVKRLLSVGFTEDQAEMQTKIIGNLVDDQLVTRYDLGKLELSIEELRRDIKESASNLKYDLTIRLGAMLTFAVTMVVLLSKISFGF